MCVRLKHLLLSFAVAAIWCGLLSGCGGGKADTAPKPDGDKRLRNLLDEIRTQSERDHPFIGTRGLQSAKDNLVRIVADPQAAPDHFAQAHGLLAEELLRAGRAAEAVEEMKLALSALPDQPSFRMLRQHVRYRLAIAALRLGETANCVHCTNGESCLLPIIAAGQHTEPTGSRLAIEHLQHVLDVDPSNLSAIWLLNIAHMTLGSYPEGVPQDFRIAPSAFEDAAADIPAFRNVASTLGLDTRNPAGSVVIDDFDNDDDLDLLTSTWDTAGPLRLFRNTGDGRFHEEIDDAGLAGLFGGLNLLQADYDNDGDVDVLVLRGAWLESQGRHPNSLLQNDGSGRFRDVTFDAGLGNVHYPTQTASWADYDNDGDLDLYIGNEQFPSQLFENDGRGVFHDVAARAGVLNERLAKAVVWGDYDQDRWPDLFVSNLPGENRLYHNNRDGTFTDVARDLQVTRPRYSFPAWFWDYDNDGRLDLYVSSYIPSIASIAADYLRRPHNSELNCLYHGNPAGGFEEVSQAMGLTRPAQPMGVNFGDVNNDGFLDFYLGTGYVDYEGLMPNLLFVNRGGVRFDDATFSARLGHLQKGHGIAFGDLDNDGDEDIFAQLGGWFRGDAFANALFENRSEPGTWLAVRLVGKQSNRSAIGARVHVVVENNETRREIFRWVNSGGSFGANPLRQHIGLAGARQVERLEVYWPTTDTTQIFHNVDVNQTIEVVEGNAGVRRMVLEPTPFANRTKTEVRVLQE